MNIASLGDLATNFGLRRDTANVKAELARATTEVSSGLSNDIVERLGGDFTRLSAIEGDLARMDAFRGNIDEYRLLLSTAQSALNNIRNLGTAANTFLSVPVGVNGPALESFGAEGLSVFTSMLQALNIQAGGRTVFAGTESHNEAVADPDTILSAIEAEMAVSGADTALAIEGIVDAWFASSGGYDAIGYLGGPVSITPMRLSDSEDASPLATAQDPVIRDALASSALAALVGRGALSGDLSNQGALIRRSGERLLVSDDRLINLQADIGRKEGALARATAEVRSQRDSLEFARAELVEVDPYEAATRLQTAELRLQSIYTITGRLSRLSLTEYL